jgi:hypothetical protein
VCCSFKIMIVYLNNPYCPSLILLPSTLTSYSPRAVPNEIRSYELLEEEKKLVQNMSILLIVNMEINTYLLYHRVFLRCCQSSWVTTFLSSVYSMLSFSLLSNHLAYYYVPSMIVETDKVRSILNKNVQVFRNVGPQVTGWIYVL